MTRQTILFAFILCITPLQSVSATNALKLQSSNLEALAQRIDAAIARTREELTQAAGNDTNINKLTNRLNSLMLEHEQVTQQCIRLLIEATKQNLALRIEQKQLRKKINARKK